MLRICQTKSALIIPSSSKMTIKEQSKVMKCNCTLMILQIKCLIINHEEKNYTIYHIITSNRS